MAMPIQDVSHRSPFSYCLPGSIATAFGLSHDLQYSKKIDPSDVFPNEHALRHIIDFRPGSYSDGNCVYDEDCRFRKTFECPAQIYARVSYCIRPGHEWLIDGGDAMIYSKWGGYRDFLLFICAKTNYTSIYYLKDESTRSFVAILKYADRLVRVRKGYGVSTMYGDFLAAHLDTNVLDATQADLCIKLTATPPHLHCLNGYAKVYMRVLKVGTYTRSLQAAGKPIGNDNVIDATDLWCFSMEHFMLRNNNEPLTTTEQATGAYANREQMFCEAATVCNTTLRD